MFPKFKFLQKRNSASHEVALNIHGTWENVICGLRVLRLVTGARAQKPQKTHPPNPNTLTHLHTLAHSRTRALADSRTAHSQSRTHTLALAHARTRALTHSRTRAPTLAPGTRALTHWALTHLQICPRTHSPTVRSCTGALALAGVHPRTRTCRRASHSHTRTCTRAHSLTRALAHAHSCATHATVHPRTCTCALNPC